MNNINYVLKKDRGAEPYCFYFPNAIYVVEFENFNRLRVLEEGRKIGEIIKDSPTEVKIISDDLELDELKLLFFMFITARLENTQNIMDEAFTLYHPYDVLYTKCQNLFKSFKKCSKIRTDR